MRDFSSTTQQIACFSFKTQQIARESAPEWKQKNNKNCTQEMCFMYVFIVGNLQLHREGLQLHKEGLQLHSDKPSIKPRRNKSKSLKSMFLGAQINLSVQFWSQQICFNLCFCSDIFIFS